MIYLKNISYKNSVEFEVNRKDHLNRKVRIEKIKNDARYSRGPNEIKYFELIPSGMSVDFSDLTIIVGDNGVGKSTLLKTLKMPNFSKILLFNKGILKQYMDDGVRKLSFDKMPNGVLLLTDLHKSSVQKEVGDKIGADSFFGRGSIEDTVSFLLSGDDSNGEALIDIYKNIDYKNVLIVLDEPETSLSMRSIGKLKEQIVSLSKENQVIISTHHPYIMELCDTVFDMETKQHVNTKYYLQNYK